MPRRRLVLCLCSHRIIPVFLSADYSFGLGLLNFISSLLYPHSLGLALINTMIYIKKRMCLFQLPVIVSQGFPVLLYILIEDSRAYDCRLLQNYFLRFMSLETQFVFSKLKSLLLSGILLYVNLHNPF